MLFLIIILMLFCLTVLLQFLYGIFHISSNITILDLARVYYYARKAKSNYNMYLSTGDESYRQPTLDYIDSIEKYLDVYDLRYIYGIDLISIKKDVMPKPPYYDVYVK
jgi:hypothetical protein